MVRNMPAVCRETYKQRVESRAGSHDNLYEAAMRLQSTAMMATRANAVLCNITGSTSKFTQGRTLLLVRQGAVPPYLFVANCMTSSVSIGA